MTWKRIMTDACSTQARRIYVLTKATNLLSNTVLKTCFGLASGLHATLDPCRDWVLVYHDEVVKKELLQVIK